MKLVDGVHVVGGGDAGFGLSGALDANVYAIDTTEGVWLIDVGLDSVDEVLRNLEGDGLDPADVTHVFVTHYHADHAGGLAALRARLPQVSVAAAAEVAGFIEAGDEEANALAWARSIGYYPADYVLEPCPVDVRVQDGATFGAGPTSLVAVSTPGHCAGHLSFVLDTGAVRCLFSGDQLFVGGKILLQNLADASIQQSAASMRRLLDHPFDVLLPGHGMVSLQDGRRHVVAATSAFDRIGLPPNLV